MRGGALTAMSGSAMSAAQRFLHLTVSALLIFVTEEGAP
jgi:hypothetical protein